VDGFSGAECADAPAIQGLGWRGSIRQRPSWVRMHKAEPYAWSLYISWRTRARQDTTPQEPVGQTSAFRGLFDLVACGGLAT